MRLREEPKHKRAKNRFDTYLTKTSIRAIKFSENKKRWHRLVSNDLYSKTERRGVPALQRVEIKDMKYVRSPPFFKESPSPSKKNLSIEQDHLLMASTFSGPFDLGSRFKVKS